MSAGKWHYLFRELKTSFVHVSGGFLVNNEVTSNEAQEADGL